MDDALARIAAALERIAPLPMADADPLAHAAYVWMDHRLVATREFAPLPLDALLGIDAQKTALVGNLRRLADHSAAHDVFLWGARGTGKSALVKSAVAAVQSRGAGLALIELAATRLETLSALFDHIAPVPRSFVLFVDDLGFSDAGEARTLRSMLEGGAAARPANGRLVVTANRRHLVPRDIAEQESAISPRDSIDDHLALADRFGLSLGFHALDQNGYLAIVQGYATRHGLPFVAADATRFATQRGSRSGRVAWHYIVDLAGSHGRFVG